MNSSPQRSDAVLHVLAYHYVRQLPDTPYPRLKGMLASDFERQLDRLAARFEIASMESALAFLDGTYVPRRDLCLLTFDDGLRDHYEEVLPRLVKRGLEGAFFVITSCIEGHVASVHKNHFLMAALDPQAYRRRVMERLPAFDRAEMPDSDRVRATYRWDDAPTAELKYLLNFVVPAPTREALLEDLFLETFGDERAFARQLYLDWSEVTDLQRLGMSVGGHTHTHPVLSRLTPSEQREELTVSTSMLEQKLLPQWIWPFSYPFGKPDAFDSSTIDTLRDLTYTCAFTTEPGCNRSGHDRFRIRRIDPKDDAVC
jgi:peptidoglycan/xylan/chitin deacetylase (PgdA/CDA1 family)